MDASSLLGGALLLGPALYAGLLGWLRGGIGFAKPSARLASPLSFPFLKETGPGSEANQEANHQPLFSLLLAARNEAAALPHLLQALQNQTLPPYYFEVLIADDHSADGTAALVVAAAKKTPFALRLITLPPGTTGKKAALAAAEAQARAAWVVCTDADCRPAPGWLRAYADLLSAQPGLHFVSGPVRLTPGGGWFDGLLGLEFAGLVGVGAGCIGRGWPTMCNGANLAFRRATFHEVGGYADNQGIASGDDEFLLHKIHLRYPAGIHFLADARALIDTPAPATLRALLRQRVRWASKWPHYRTAAPRQLALLVLGANVSLAVGLVWALRWPALAPWVGVGWALKLGGDAWLLLPMLRLLKRRRLLAWLLPLQLLYAPYGLAVGLAGQRGGYRWKGRQVR
ncbi:glycosyltransferase [Hymenobacter sp. HMF4947]|uniref:Glycosyltransferase n=1 Tax=Hymenobacter ginkgonis TaxID=2682976 RepID=A0A7K1T9H4_9BACT|nr:glycosyltransferase [Hymenobacter ginkgonis]MVN75050.1 glycosyltransferase [Hymenobacter ginkgonis]